MSQIAYDPVKDRFATIIRNSRFLRGVFYALLDLFFLRSWYVRKYLREVHSASLPGVLMSGKPLKILDAGCGFGQYDQFMIRSLSNIKIDAVDIKEDYLNDCRHYFKSDIKRGVIDFKNVDLLNPGISKTYHIVLCVDVLEHIEEDVKVMKNLCDVLKPGGYFLMHSPSHLAEDDADGDDSFVGEHARAGYSKEDISEKLRRAGLNPVKMEYSYGSAGHFAWEILIKWPMLWLTRIGFTAMLLLPFWYILTLIPGLVLMQVDMLRENRTGTGIVVLAQKPE